MDKYIGRRLDGRYEIREMIGVGGMAFVYKAYDTIDDSIVAVKILKDEFLNNEELSRRFKNESKAMARLSHKNVVRVNDVSFSDSLQYIVMEYIDGITLKEYIDRQKLLKWKEVVHFIVQILQALQHAHDKGIVHQDVKPQNIMLLSDGTVKVTDFGIARFSRSSQQAQHGDKAIGSVHYISPEQARAEITDEKSDIYSVGVMMYEMLTGKLPFESDNAVSVAIMQMQSIATRPTEINPGIPEGLEEITLKAMQKNPQKRYQSAAEMLYDIDEFKNNPSIRFEYQYLTGDDDMSNYQSTIDLVRGVDTRRSKATVPTEPDDEEYDDDYEDEEYGSRRALPVIPILATIAGVVFMVVMVFLFINVFQGSNGSNGTRNIPVPDVIGKNYEELKASGELAGFTIIEKNEFGKGHKGIIYDQEPAPGRQAKEGSVLTLYISLGSGKKVPVPDVYNVTKELAVSMLEGANFVVTVKEEYHDTVEAGRVYDVSPAIGVELSEGEEITLFVSRGIEPAELSVVPNVAGKRQIEAALVEIEEAGYTVTSIEYVNNSLSKGYVISQTPAGDTECMDDTPVTLVVSTGAAVLEINAPTLSYNVDYRFFIDGTERSDLALTNKSYYAQSKQTVSLTEAKASYTVRVQITKSGKDRYEDYAKFTITNSQSGCDIATEYFNITVMPDDIEVPNVVGKEYTETLITDLKVEVVREYNRDVQAGFIYAQSIAAGEIVEENSVIVLYVSKGVEYVVVPDIAVGTGYTSVKGELEAAGFKVVVMEEAYAGEDILPGCLIRLGTSAGTSLPKGDTIVVYLRAEEITPVEPNVPEGGDTVTP